MTTKTKPPRKGLDIAKKYEKYLKSRNETKMGCKLGKKLLYDLCKKHPLHVDGDEIFSKVLLIGRTLAAAIERGGKGKVDIRTFYWKKVVPAFTKNAKAIDGGIAELNGAKGGFVENAEKALALHKTLLDVIKGVTGVNKRSLASKYLHFHCPSQVLIYDSRACEAAQHLVPNHKVPPEWKKYDGKYAMFVARVLVIADTIKEEKGEQVTPKDIDDFLLQLD